jgi:hypothetical protein
VLLVTGRYHTKYPMHCDHFLICCAVHLSFNHPSVLWLQHRHLVAKLGETWRDMSLKLADVVSLSCYARFFNILQYGADGFTSPPKEGVPRIFISPKNPSSRPGFNPRTLGPMASTLTISPPRRIQGGVRAVMYCLMVDIRMMLHF